ncbi:TIGR02147 family protein [Bacteriovoracaceae bacterium]|nr:TIGR02147 family protein [Bacteriovoracaceae bacterium]
MRNEKFRQHLQQELIRKIEGNSNFSARAFAKQLKIEPSSFIQILNGKRSLTDKMCLRLAEALCLSPEQVKDLMGVGKEDTGSGPFDSFSNISMDAFKVISDWHHYAILELTYLKHFQPDLKWISKSLGISTHEVRDAVERLQRLDFLIIKDGKWTDNLGDANNFGNEYTTAAVRKLQKQVLEKAIVALENISYEERVQTSMTLPVSKRKVKEAKSRILHFVDELDAFLRNDSDLDDIYHISFSLYPISNTQENQT